MSIYCQRLHIFLTCFLPLPLLSPYPLHYEKYSSYLLSEDIIYTSDLLHIPNTLWVVLLAYFPRNLSFFDHLEMLFIVDMIEIYSS
jgi:hypothetical protein